TPQGQGASPHSRGSDQSDRRPRLHRHTDSQLTFGRRSPDLADGSAGDDQRSKDLEGYSFKRAGQQVFAEAQKSDGKSVVFRDPGPGDSRSAIAAAFGP